MASAAAVVVGSPPDGTGAQRPSSAAPRDGFYPMHAVQPVAVSGLFSQLEREKSLVPKRSENRRNSNDVSKAVFHRCKSEIAVGTLIAERPPHRTERAQFEHSAPTSGA